MLRIKSLGNGRFLLLLLFLILSLTIVEVQADAALINQKLSGSTPLADKSKIPEFRISPDGQTVVFMAHIEPTSTYELYSVPMNGSAEPTRLTTGLLPEGADIGHGYQITPDSRRVVYRAQQDSSNVYELYSVSITGGPITKLNPPITVGGGNVSQFALSPDGYHVVYNVDWQINNQYELFSIPVTGGIPVRLNSDLPAGGSVVHFEITPDSNNVVYYATQDDPLYYELYNVPLTGGDNFKLNDPLVAGGYVSNYKIAPDGTRVVYIANQDSSDVDELYSVSLNSPLADAIKLNPPLVANGRVSAHGFEISPDSSRVVYAAKQDTDIFYELYSVPLLGGTAVKLNAPLPFGSNNFASCFVGDPCVAITPNSRHVVYLAEQDTAGMIELYRTSLTGGPVAKLNGPILHVNGDVDTFTLSPDGQRVVYLADQQDLGADELYSVSIRGGAVAKLNSALPPSGFVADFRISLDSQRAIYVARQQDASVFEVYSVPLKDGAITKLNPPLVEGGGVNWGIEISPNSNHVVYAAKQEYENVGELFVSFSEPQLVQFEEETLVVDEVDGTVMLTVIQAEPSLATTTVAYAISGGTAVNGEDYNLTAGTVTFLPGEIEQQIEIKIVEDVLAEGDETAVITLSDPQNGILGAQSSLTLTIAGEQETFSVYLPMITK